MFKFDIRRLFRKGYYLSIIIVCIFLFTTCRKLQQQVPITLPPFHSQLGVECYLGLLDGDDCPNEKQIHIQAAISQTQDYFSTVTLGALQVKGATVTVSYDSAGQTYSETLKENNFFNTCDTSNIKFYNYKSMKSPANAIHYHTGILYKLKVDDHAGRIATSETQWLDPVKVDTITTLYNPRDTNYSLIIHWKDATPDADFYRIQVKVLNLDSTKHRGHILKQDVVLADDLNNNGNLAIGTRYTFKTGDSIEVKLFHVRKEYYHYVRTVNAAVNSMGNPFGQPATIATNITNGIGIFTPMAWTKKIFKL